MRDDLEHLVTELEAMFAVGDASVCRTSATGEDFVNFYPGGRCEYAGRPVGKVWCADPETAVSLLRLQILDYAAGRSGVLYWRTKPEEEETYIHTSELRLCGGNNARNMLIKRPVYTAYARLLISDNPIIGTPAGGRL